MANLKLLYYHGEKRNPYFIVRNLAKLEGMFSYVIEDTEKDELLLMQDRLGDSACLYYTIVDGKLHYSNDYHELCGKISLPSLDMEAVRQRFMSDFVWGDRTLIAQIKKVPLHCLMVYNRGTKQINYYRIKFEGGDRSGNIVENGAYEAILPRYPEVSAIAYSAGFDSNMLFHNYYHPDIKLFTIGANEGRDDSERAKTIVNNSRLDNSNLFIKKPTYHLLQEFPNLVNICGEHWNKGAFTTYLLGQLLREHHIDEVLIGEGGNESFTKMYQFFLDTISLEWNFNEKKEYWENASSSLGMVSNRAIKRTGAIMSYFNIKPIWPFLDTNYLNSLDPTTENYDNQMAYRARVLNMMTPASREVVKSQGGSFELINLFKDKTDFNKYFEFAQKSKFLPIYLKAHPEIANKKDENLRECVFNILFMHLFEEIFVNRKEITTLDEMLGL